MIQANSKERRRLVQCATLVELLAGHSVHQSSVVSVGLRQIGHVRIETLCRLSGLQHPWRIGEVGLHLP